MKMLFLYHPNYLINNISYYRLIIMFQPDIQSAVEAVENLRLTESLEQEAQEWQDIIFDIIRTIKV